MNLDRSRGLDELVAQVEGKPEAMVALARLLRPGDNPILAVKLCNRAVEMAPDNGEVRAIAQEVLSAGVPLWHFDIVRDHPRNNAYEAALRRAIFPGCKVLEIGAGSGLLAMMAARAGAAKVITCEIDAAIGSAAQAVVERNGFGDQVRVVVKHSTALDVEADLGGPADILVSEIVANDLLGEGVLPSMEDAIKRLIKPGAKILPFNGRVRVALGDDDEWEDSRMGSVAGFDLSPFNRISSPHRDIYVGASRLIMRSDAADLFSFDFASGGPYPDQKREISLISHGHRVNGIAQWIALDMDKDAVYENKPDPGTSSSWMIVYYPFERQLKTTPGQVVKVHARHDRQGLRLWVDLPN